LVKNSDAVAEVVAAQLRTAQAAGSTPAFVDPDLEALGLLAMSAGLATSVLAGQSSIERAQAVIDYHLHRLFPLPRRRRDNRSNPRRQITVPPSADASAMIYRGSMKPARLTRVARAQD
jgi:hypothetical protein